MIAVVQRTTGASVTIDNKLHSETGRGFLVLLGIYATDTQKQAELLATKISKLRVFEDNEGKMNLSPLQLLNDGNDCHIMVVSQFTLCAECKGQNRPSFIKAAGPDIAVPLYEYFVELLRKQGLEVETGRFGADMKVGLINDGPVTIILDTDKL